MSEESKRVMDNFMRKLYNGELEYEREQAYESVKFPWSKKYMEEQKQLFITFLRDSNEFFEDAGC